MASFFVLAVFLVLFSSLAFAHEEANFGRAIAIIDEQIPCESLSDDDLEILGEYYMDERYGEDHAATLDKLGLVDGSEREERFHIDLGKDMYCKEPSRAGLVIISLVAGAAVVVAAIFWLLYRKSPKN